MAEVVPFRGVLYNPDSIDNLADVTAPPYDVISLKAQERFYRRHPNNVVRLILGKSRAGDKDQSDIHARAADYFNQWLRTDILVRDRVPAFYLTRVVFDLNREKIARFGLIGCVRLEPFDKGIVLPHERTFSKIKGERLQLMQACHANFSPIFGLYPDPDDILTRFRDLAAKQAPELDFTDDTGSRHSLWRLTDAKIQADIQAALDHQAIYIADGHHRYETALNYRDLVMRDTPSFGDDHPANFIMMSLSSMRDPGMVILPAHRLLKGVGPDTRKAMLTKAGDYFEIERFSSPKGDADVLAQMDAALLENVHRNAIGVCMQDDPSLYVLALRSGVMERLFGKELDEPLRDLDVSVLTHLLMMEMLGFDQARLDDASLIGYTTASDSAVGAVREGLADLAFILNPTKIEQVQRVAGEGLIMPRKSTYFYPKVISGQVFNLLR